MGPFDLITSGLLVTREQRPEMSPNPQMFAQDCSEEELGAICEVLFVSQRDHRIEVHGPTRRDVARGERDEDQKNRDACKR